LQRRLAVWLELGRNHPSQYHLITNVLQSENDRNQPTLPFKVVLNLKMKVKIRLWDKKKDEIGKVKRVINMLM
jgi:hypothetical protein